MIQLTEPQKQENQTYNHWQTHFQDRVVLVTGGSSGIGYGIAEKFVQAGAIVVVMGTNEERGWQAERALEKLAPDSHQRALFIHGDVTSSEDLERVITYIDERFGQLDVVVCSAGIGRKATLLETTLEDLDRLYRVNVQGAVMTVKTAAKLLQRSEGSVVLISSDAGILGESHAGAYSVTKAAVNMAGKMLALDLAVHGVRVNIVAPGDIAPGMRSMLNVGETVRPKDDYLSWSVPPVGRYGNAADVAGTVLFLASPEASFITGSILLVDGGMRAGFPTDITTAIPNERGIKHA
ncbi:SDR family oxidoreductase [Brevibacillus fluminis]|uniref:SDR family oxidoreductase n=1 Tax=Brevibacillus fluminis TaxID=511487 RepID=A0A3M8DBF1_9BACL|nr:SDR family oxidoreductase [Brevibacillus fluminis]